MICIGHSHVVCVLDAAHEEGIPCRAVAIKEFKSEFKALRKGRDDRVIRIQGNSELSDEAKELLSRSDEPIYSFVGGTGHVRLPLQALGVVGQPAYDFVLPDAPSLPLDEAAALVPYDAMHEVVDRSARLRLRALKEIVELAPGRVVQFGPPPPVSDRFVREWVVREYGADAAGRSGMPSRFLRYKIWRVTTDVARSRSAELGAEFVDVPAASMDDEGFMRDELVRNIAHGNSAYGRLILEQIGALS